VFSAIVGGALRLMAVPPDQPIKSIEEMPALQAQSRAAPARR
jgi:hypothetical protein